MAAFLEFIFDRCSNVYIAAIVLMRVYTILGNMSRIVALFNQLDIKWVFPNFLVCFQKTL